MKLYASRDERDLDDAALLFNTLGYTSAQECVDLLASRYPVARLLPCHGYIADDVIRRAETLRTTATDANPGEVLRRRARMQNQDPDDHRDVFSDPGRSPRGPGSTGPGRTL